MSELSRVAFETAAKNAAWPVLPVLMADTRTGEIVYVSKYASDIFGYEQDELLGQPVEVLIPEKLRHQHSMWRQDVNVPRTRLMGVGRQIFGRRKDGVTFPLHIGLTEMKTMDRSIGIALLIDLTGISLVSGQTSEGG